jgi:hypothetical protein
MTAGYPVPLTWARLLELAAQGHDHYDAALTSTRARQLVASVEETFPDEAEYEQLRRSHAAACQTLRLDPFEASPNDIRAGIAAANATLKRVRAVLNSLRNKLGRLPDALYRDSPLPSWLAALDAVLADQPEAPLPAGSADCSPETPCERCQPEAPKGQAVTPEQGNDILRRMADSELAKVRAENVSLESRLADYQAMVDDLEPHDVLIHWRQDRADLAAANARIAELKLKCVDKCDAERAALTAERNRANARIAELETWGNDWANVARADNARVAELIEQLAAAKTKIAELEKWCDEYKARLEAANARADAAERDSQLLERIRQRLQWLLRRASCDGFVTASEAIDALADLSNETERAAPLLNYRKLEAERNQLAARVKELESELGLPAHARTPLSDLINTCTPEERAVLEATEDIREETLVYWRDYIGDSPENDDERLAFLAVCELANRAAKASKGAGGGA